MSIVTKTGDEGLTGLWSGERVSKDDARVEAYGTVDELDSVLGEARHYARRDDTRRLIEMVQRDLFRVAGQLATSTGARKDSMTEDDAEKLGAEVARLEAELRLTGFVVPGATPQSAKLDVARTVCRRAERRVVTLARDAEVSPALRKYMNRLSDLLFMMARAEEASDGGVVYLKP